MAASTEEVLNHHLQAFGEGNLEAILEDYNEDSILCTPDGLLEGLNEIKPPVRVLLCGIRQAGRFLRHGPANRPGRAGLHCLARGIRGQAFRPGHGHIHRSRRQNRRADLRGQDDGEELVS